jgi:hypothetical protein
MTFGSNIDFAADDNHAFLAGAARTRSPAFISPIAARMVGLGMSNSAKTEMDVDVFLAWGEGRDGR